MIKRTIDISEPAYVHLKQRQLLVERDAAVICRVPIEDLGVLILQHAAILITQAVLISCQQNNVVVVFCDERHLPYSVLLPISTGNNLHTKVLREQIGVSKAVHKRLWKHIVSHKINHQAALLDNLGKQSIQIKRLASQVKSGDRDNHESQAAKKYWRLLLGVNFRRNRNEPGINALLNYGYAIVRAVMARAIVSTGLHPALGIHHSNQYNGLCLADDLMEPLRPLVDAAVYRIVEQNPGAVIDRESKQILLSILSQPIFWRKRTMPLMVSLHYLAAEFKLALTDSKLKIQYPLCIYGDE